MKNRYKELSTVELIKMIDDDKIATELMRRFNQPEPKSDEVFNLDRLVDNLQRKIDELEKVK